MGLPRPPGFAAFKSWFIRALNSRLGKVDPQTQSTSHSSARPTRPFAYSYSLQRLYARTVGTVGLRPQHSRGYHRFHTSRFNTPSPHPVRIKFQPAAYFLRPQIGAFPRSILGSTLGGPARFHSSPASSAVALQQVAHSVSKALQKGLHPPSQISLPIEGQILVEVAARAACQTADGPAGYIRFTLSPPAWTPTDTDLSDPDLLNAIDTHIMELRRVKDALLKLKDYGDFPVRAMLPTDTEARIDVLFRGATAEDVARWNKNEFKLKTGRVGADQVFCAGRFEEFVRWSEVLDAEKKVDKEMEKAADGGLLRFWEQLNSLEGRIR